MIRNKGIRRSAEAAKFSQHSRTRSWCSSALQSPATPTSLGHAIGTLAALDLKLGGDSKRIGRKWGRELTRLLPAVCPWIS